MAGSEKNLVLSGKNGYVPNQPLFGDGYPDTLVAGENGIFENDSWRTFGGFADQSETRSDSAFAYTATTTNGSTTVVLSGGATAVADIRARQHLIIGGNLYLVMSVTDNTHLEVRPAATAGASGLAVKVVPTLNELHFARATQSSGNSSFFGNAIFTVGSGIVYRNGTALSPTLTASESLAVSYDNGTSVHAAGFTAYASAPTVVDGSAGSKGMPAAKYAVALIKKRTNFSGQGNPSVRGYATTTVDGHKLKVTLPAFDSTEGQTAWIICVCRRAEINAGVNSEDIALWEYPDEFTTASVDVEIEWYDEDLLIPASYDNDPPPKALYVGSLGNYLVLASTDGDPKNSISSTPGAFIAASKSNNPEAFSPFARTRTPNSELICGMHVSKYVIYLLTDNNLGVASLSGSAINPFTMRMEWGFGFLHQGQGVIINEQFYGFAGQGLYRTAASGPNKEDTVALDDFAIPVRTDMKDLEPSHVFLGKDIQRTQLVVFHSCHEKRGGYWITKCWVYNYQTGKWSLPVILSLTGADCIVTSCATIENKLYFVCSNGKTYLWDRGTQTQAGYLAFPFISAGSNNNLVAGRVTITGNVDGQAELYKNLKLDDMKAGTSPAAQRPAAFVSSGKTQSFPVWQPSINCETVALKIPFLALAANSPLLTGVLFDCLVYEGFRR